MKEKVKKYTIRVLRHGKILKEWKGQTSNFVGFKFLLDYQSSSVMWACKYEGYEITEEEEKDE